MKNNIFVATLLLSFSFFCWAETKTIILTSGKLEASYSSWGTPALSGDWKIVHEEGKTYLDLGKNFQAKKGPDVKIFLSPVGADKITEKNASNDAIFVKLLDKFKGQERIELPENIDITTFKSIIFHCEKYSKLWGSSSLH
jgi:hypothetical protein